MEHQGRQQLKLLERIAEGIEKLAQDPVVEMEIGPPICPHCHKINPSVTTQQDSGTGNLFEFYVEMICNECGTLFFGVPVQWSMHIASETLRFEIDGRRGEQERAEHEYQRNRNSE